MKIIRLLSFSVALVCASPLVLTTGCQTGSTAQAVEVTTLKVLHTSVDAAMATGAQALKDGKITVAQWQTVATFYDQTFQPAFNVAVAGANSNINSVASPDLVAMGAKIGALVAQLLPKS